MHKLTIRVEGPRGSGKSWILNKLERDLRLNNFAIGSRRAEGNVEELDVVMLQNPETNSKGELTK